MPVLNQKLALLALEDFQNKNLSRIKTIGDCIILEDASPRTKFNYQGVCIPVYRWVLQAQTSHSLEAESIARHTCDNPYCFNPTHIIEGNRAENNNDRASEHYFASPSEKDLEELFQ